jgi:hypothetical protein
MENFQEDNGGALLDDGKLQSIICTTKLDPQTIGTFTERLQEIGELYSFLKSLARTAPANEIAKKCDSVAMLTDKLLDILSLDSPGGIEVNLLLEKFGVESQETYGELFKLNGIAHEAADFMRKAMKGTIASALAEDFEYENDKIDKREDLECEDEDSQENQSDDQLDEQEIRRRIGAAVLIGSLVASKRKHRQTPETKLFLNLRELFVDLGGSPALSSKRLYKFIEACARAIDESIRIPSQASLYDLLKKATRRGPPNLVE